MSIARYFIVVKESEGLLIGDEICIEFRVICGMGILGAKEWDRS